MITIIMTVIIMITTIMCESMYGKAKIDHVNIIMTYERCLAIHTLISSLAEGIRRLT